MKKIVFIANVDCGTGMSGGSKIYFELLKRFGDSFQLFFLGSLGTINRLKQENLNNITYIETDNKDDPNLYSALGLLTHSLRRLIKGIIAIYKASNMINQANYVYSASDFWPDIIPALILKLKNPRIKWITAFYFFAPTPWQKDNPYSISISRRFIGFFYWFTQSLTYQVIKRWANLVVACNEIDHKVFIRDGFPAKNIIAIYGGVDLDMINKISAPEKKVYDAVFMARFHPQKGPVIAVETWKEVVKVRPKAKLAMIGNGSEEDKVISLIKQYHLTDNVKLFGFVDGKEKYRILKSSKIFIHPAIYETGGMAAAEGMACGLPVVAFDHEGFEYCYPYGMLTISPIGDYHKMAESILELIANKEKYAKIRGAALELVAKEWDWNKRSSLILKTIQGIEN